MSSHLEQQEHKEDGDHHNHCHYHGHGHQDMNEDWKTLENSAAFVLPYVTPGSRVLDAGCGSGALTVQFAKRFAGSKFTGVDVDEPSLKVARSSYSAEEHPNLSYKKGSLTELPFESSSFDIVYSFQVIHHVDNAAKAFAEMKRVCSPSGIVAVRENVFDTAWYPSNDALKSWGPSCAKAVRALGSNPDVVYDLPKLAEDAGFEKVDTSASTWCFSTLADRKWWAGRWERAFAKHHMADEMRKMGMSSDYLEGIVQSMKEWSQKDYAWCVVTFGEIICHV